MNATLVKASQFWTFRLRTRVQGGALRCMPMVAAVAQALLLATARVYSASGKQVNISNSITVYSAQFVLGGSGAVGNQSLLLHLPRVRCI